MTNKNEEKTLAHVDAMGDSSDSRTASAVAPTSHTPGPWLSDGPGNIWTVGDPYGAGQMYVAQVRGWGHLTGRGGGCAFDDDKATAIQDANARLIAAAPDLLAALKFAARVMETFEIGVDREIRLAIAKAEGQ